MIQDIEPKILNNAYEWRKPKKDSRILIFYGDRILCKKSEDKITYLTFEELGCYDDTLTYLFSIDEMSYYLYMTEEKLHIKGYEYVKVFQLRKMLPQDIVFAGVTGYHLFQWYWDNRFCGRCGNKLLPDKNQRMLECPHCENMVFPRINPAVIVGVYHEDELLLTRYADREYKKYALIAGFTEIGESVEETVKREVMEEVGIEVTDIKYYKSQPWGFTGGLLMGFFAKAKGSLKITRQEEELAEALWVKREEIQLDPEEMSLTREMMKVFKENMMIDQNKK